MSFEPCPPGRSLEKNSRCPSRETAGAASKPGPFTLGPRLTGSPHGALSDARRETQMSAPPSPPERVETKYRLSSSGDSAAFISYAVFCLKKKKYYQKKWIESPTKKTLTPYY